MKIGRGLALANAPFFETYFDIARNKPYTY